VHEQSLGFPALRDSIAHLEQRFVHLEQRFDARFEALDRRVDRLDDKVSRQFVWVVGIQVTVLIAVIAGLLSR
jgi:hypothetical protein